MGCGASKGSEEKNTKETKIDFKHLNVWEMDRFFDQVKELLESVEKLMKPYNEARDTFYEATKFYEVPGASNE